MCWPRHADQAQLEEVVHRCGLDDSPDQEEWAAICHTRQQHTHRVAAWHLLRRFGRVNTTLATCHVWQDIPDVPAAETSTSCSKIHAVALLDIFPERTKAISQTAVVNTALQAGYRCSRRHRLLRQGLPHLFLGIYVLQAWRACSMMEPWQHLLPRSLFAAETGTSCSKIHAVALLDIFPERTKPSAKQQWSTLRFKPATGAQGVIGYFGRASRTCS